MNGSSIENVVKATNLTGSISGVAAYQQEILANGPITVAYTVYEDFLTYSGGV